jgi:hypothetical protein
MHISFEPVTTHFSATNAVALAMASLIAYQKPDDARKLAASELGLDQFYEPFEHHNFAIDTQGFVAAGKNHVVLAFRGTEPGKFKDWATDVLATPGEFRWFFERAPDVGSVHAGFANSLRDASTVFEQRNFLARAFQTMTKVVDDFLKTPQLVADHNMEKGYFKSIQTASDTATWERALPGDWRH